MKIDEIEDKLSERCEVLEARVGRLEEKGTIGIDIETNSGGFIDGNAMVISRLHKKVEELQRELDECKRKSEHVIIRRLEAKLRGLGDKASQQFQRIKTLDAENFFQWTIIRNKEHTIELRDAEIKELKAEYVAISSGSQADEIKVQKNMIAARDKTISVMQGQGVAKGLCEIIKGLEDEIKELRHRLERTENSNQAASMIIEDLEAKVENLQGILDNA